MTIITSDFYCRIAILWMTIRSNKTHKMSPRWHHKIRSTPALRILKFRSYMIKKRLLNQTNGTWMRFSKISLRTPLTKSFITQLFKILVAMEEVHPQKEKINSMVKSKINNLMINFLMILFLLPIGINQVSCLKKLAVLDLLKFMKKRRKGKNMTFKCRYHYKIQILFQNIKK